MSPKPTVGMIFKVPFNNQGWSGRCKNVQVNRRKLFFCLERRINVKPQIGSDGHCNGNCWDSRLCRDYTLKLDQNFDTTRAKGKVYFVFRDRDENKSLTIWGSSRVCSVDGKEIRFTEFRPWPTIRWVSRFNPKSTLGTQWGQGMYRYLDAPQLRKLKAFISNRRQKSSPEPVDSVEPDATYTERRRILMKKHLATERSAKLVWAFKRTLDDFKCRVCGFDFRQMYGELGVGFIEAHHNKPLAGIRKVRVTRVRDLVAVCSNCHRMIHHQSRCMDWKKLKETVRRQRGRQR